MAADLPANASPQDYQKYYNSLSPDQQRQFRKAGLMQLINTIYTSKASDVIEDAPPRKGTVASGKFMDGKQVFDFEIRKSGGQFLLDYKPS